MIRLTTLGGRDGTVEGEAGSFCWEARLARAPVSYGLNPKTLYKGRGRVARLVLYERLPGTGLRQKVAAYNQGWLFGRQAHAPLLSRLVRYLEQV
jgi:hypothetical protein